MPASYRLLGGFFVIANALGIDSVIVFPNGDIQRPVDFGTKHVTLHLYPMLEL
jgi:hypothetical protein